jgi:hypothetical protein
MTTDPQNRRAQVREKFLELLQGHPEGRRWSELVEELQKAFPEFPYGTLTGNVWNLDQVMPDTVGKYSRGVWVLKEFMAASESTTTDVQAAEGPGSKPKEEEFYEAFAGYLETELQECTKVMALSGNLFKDKWGTPDVIGVLKPKPSDVIKFPVEIISIEVKTDTSQLITAFGQACSYKLFSHKAYIVVPSDSPTPDVERLESLCLIFGIGLITFDRTDPKKPGFTIRCRATKTEPDMFYVNEKIKLVADRLLG